MKCKHCGYDRQIIKYCASCGASINHSGTFDEYLVDYFTKIQIKNTSIYIFPTILGNDKSIGHWTEDVNIDMCFRTELQSRSMIGHSIDVVVNSANNFLIPGAGLAKYLRSKLTREYDDGCTQLLRNETLQKGKAYLVPIASQFRIKYGIIEAVTIEYKKKESGLERVLSNSMDVYHGVYSSLALCDKKGFKSIAFPQMASRAGYSIYQNQPSKKMMASTYLAIHDYLESTHSDIEQIYLHPSDLQSEELFLGLFDSNFLLSIIN